LQEGLKNWLIDIKIQNKEAGTAARRVNIDGSDTKYPQRYGERFSCGKRVDRGAWINAGAVVGNGRIGNGVSAGNEIQAAPKLLDSLDVKGDVVTADAVICQMEIVKKIRELPEDLWQREEERGHGRVERQDLKTIVHYRTFRTQKGKETVQTDRYYLSSGDFSVDEFLKYIRGRWSI
jgi:predicted transposase YbfD/YdcC